MRAKTLEERQAEMRLRCQRRGDRPRTHGMSGTPEWFACNQAKQRCTNPRHPAWKDYGGRGIKFLFTSFEQFFTELGPRPAGMSLDRIDNDGNYEPGNVRWATAKEQQSNQRPYLRFVRKPRLEKYSQPLLVGYPC